jgi:hypothetical protein
MDPTTYALCQKSVIGPAMWIASLCVFPPLFAHVPLSLETEGFSVSQEFSAPVDRKYNLTLTFEFPTTAERLNDEILGSRYEARCEGRVEDIPQENAFGLGRKIPFRVVVRRKQDSSVVVEKEFVSWCVTSAGSKTKTRSIGWLELNKGEYIAEVVNIAAQDGLGSIHTTISLVPGGSGK